MVVFVNLFFMLSVITFAFWLLCLAAGSDLIQFGHFLACFGFFLFAAYLHGKG